MTVTPQSVELVQISGLEDDEDGEEDEQEQDDQGSGPSEICSNGRFVRSFPPQVERFLCRRHQGRSAGPAS
jgi:hypothetical protein